MKFKLTTREIVIMGVLIAMKVILTRFLGIDIGTLMRVNFSFIATAIMAVTFGPLWTAIGCGISDVLGFFLFSSGSFFPGFTFSAMVAGWIYGTLLYQKHFSWWRIILIQILSLTIITFGLNSLWVSMLYGNSFFVVLSGRIAVNVATLPVDIILLGLTGKYLLPQLRFVLKTNAPLSSEEHDIGLPIDDDVEPAV